MNIARPFPALALAAALFCAPCGAAPGTAPASSAPTGKAPAAEAPRGRACEPRARASASAALGTRSNRARHIPDEGDPCADSTGAVEQPRR